MSIKKRLSKLETVLKSIKQDEDEALRTKYQVNMKNLTDHELRRLLELIEAEGEKTRELTPGELEELEVILLKLEG